MNFLRLGSNLLMLEKEEAISINHDNKSGCA